jgi:hypothetical protein
MKLEKYLFVFLSGIPSTNGPSFAQVQPTQRSAHVENQKLPCQTTSGDFFVTFSTFYQASAEERGQRYLLQRVMYFSQELAL